MFTCLVQELQYALSVVGPTLGSEGHGHAGIRIKTHKSKDRVKLITTEGAFSTEIWIDATVRGKIDTVVEGDRFKNYITKLDAKEATLEMAGEKMVVKSSRGKPTFVVYDPTSFPELPKIEKAISFNLAGKVFKKLVGDVAFATKSEKKGSTDAPLLEGINIVSDGKRLAFTTMNGFVIASCKKKVETELMNLTVAKKSLVNSAKTARDADKVTVQAESARLIVKHNDITYYIPVYGGEYPTFKLPSKDFMTSFVLEKEELLGVLERGASMLEDGGSSKGILQVEKGKVIVEGKTQRNDFHETITTDIKGGKANVTIDLKRMTEVIKNVDAEHIQIGIDKGKPITIRPEGRVDQTCMFATG